MQNIVTLTMNPALDKSATVEQVTSNRKLRAEGVRRDPGGGGINVSRAIQHIGGNSIAIYVSGGIEGRLLEDLLAKETVEQIPVQIEDSVRESLTILERSTGNQYRFGMPGPRLNASEIDAISSRVDEQIGPDSFFVASGSLPPDVPTDFYARLARAAAKQGARIIVDTSGEALREAVSEGIFLIKPNLHELASLVGARQLEGPQIREAATELVSRGKTQHVVVSLGSGGAMLANADGITKYAAPTVQVHSRIGAGDSMIGGIVYALARGESIEEATRWGIAAGAAAVMTPGTELCRGEDVRRLLDEVG